MVARTAITQRSALLPACDFRHYHHQRHQQSLIILPTFLLLNCIRTYEFRNKMKTDVKYQQKIKALILSIKQIKKFFVLVCLKFRPHFSCMVVCKLCFVRLDVTGARTNKRTNKVVFVSSRRRSPAINSEICNLKRTVCIYGAKLNIYSRPSSSRIKLMLKIS